MLGFWPIASAPLSALRQAAAAGGAGDQTLTQSSIFTDGDTFYTHTLSATITLTQSSIFNDADTFYTHTLTVGGVTLTQSATYSDDDTFYAHTLVQQTNQTLVQTERYDDPDTFFATEPDAPARPAGGGGSRLRRPKDRYGRDLVIARDPTPEPETVEAELERVLAKPAPKVVRVKRPTIEPVAVSPPAPDLAAMIEEDDELVLLLA